MLDVPKQEVGANGDNDLAAFGDRTQLCCHAILPRSLKCRYVNLETGRARREPGVTACIPERPNLGFLAPPANDSSNAGMGRESRNVRDLDAPLPGRPCAGWPSSERDRPKIDQAIGGRITENNAQTPRSFLVASKTKNTCPAPLHGGGKSFQQPCEGDTRHGSISEVHLPRKAPSVLRLCCGLFALVKSRR